MKMRNPYPVPDMSSEGDWMPPGPTLANNVSINDRDWWTKVPTHERLFSHHTLTSIRRDSRLIKSDELIPIDALDFALSSIYIHSEDCNVPKMYVPMQPESMNMETWRVLRNEINNASGEISLSMKSIPKHNANNNVNHTIHKSTRKSSSASYSGPTTKNKTTINKTKPKINNKNNKKLQIHNNTINNNKKKINKSGVGAGGKNKSGAGRSARSKSRGQSSSVSSRRKNGRKPAVVGNRQNNKLSSIKNKRFKNDQEEKDDSREKEPRRKNFAAQMMAIERIHPSSIKLAIDGPHTDQTNPGFSRKIDGTFYSI